MKHKYSFIFTICLSCIMFFIFCYLMYSFDNKYTKNYYQYRDGILDLSNNDFNKNPLFELVYNWEVYPDVHLMPEEIKNYTAQYRIFIGEYSGFDFKDKSHSYFGKVTYHLRVALPKETACYTLELPEIFSAYDLYINGKLLAQCGDISSENYTAETKSGTISFFAKDGIDIVINVSNYDHYYGGLVYPPAFGSQDAVSKLILTRIIYRSMLVFISFTLGILFLLAGYRSSKIYLVFTLLSVLFIGYISYPIIHSLFKCGLWTYKVEVLCYYGFITVILFIQDNICGFKKEKYDLAANSFANNSYIFFSTYIRKYMYLFSFIIILESLIPARIICSSNALIIMHSGMRTIYKYSAFLYLIISTAIAASKEIKYSKLLFVGFTIVAVSFFADRVFPLYEPIRFGWFYEHSGFILLCIIGYILALTFADFYSSNQKLSVQLDMQRDYYDVVKENINNTRKLRHNINNHILVMKSFLENHNEEKLWEYISNYTAELPQFKQIVFCDNIALNVLVSYYYSIAVKKNINVKINRFEISNDISDIEPDLCVLIGNLFTNAIEACEKISKKEKIIILDAHMQGNVISIIAKNNFENEPVIINNVFLSSKRVKKEGIGIPSIKNIVKKYNGRYKFNVNKDELMFEVYITIIH